MNDVKRQFINELKGILKQLEIEADSILLERPSDLSMGDYSTNIAMVSAKKNKQNPKDLADRIVEKINLKITNFTYLKKAEVAGPGFINFYLKDDFFKRNIEKILKEKDFYGRNDFLKGKKILIEHSSPNLFKEFHIGHMVNNSIGESIVRIIKNLGADVTAISYPSDVGLGIAKTVWALLNNNFLKENNALFLKEYSLEDKINFLGKAYVFGVSSYKENESMRKEIDETNKKIYDKSDKEINKIYQQGRKLTLEYFEKITARLGSKFDDYIFESEAGEEGKKIVKDNIGKVFEESEGAIIFNAKKFNEKLHTRVFLNSFGLPTYDTKDLGLLKLKFDKYNPDLSLFITDNEQSEYIKVMLKAAEQINPVWAEKTKHLAHGRLRFPEGRLSSRDGNVLIASSLLDRIKKDILKKMTNFVGEKGETAEAVAVGAIKYSILKSTAGKNIIFDKEKALSLEGNSGPYLQYTYARAKSIIEKAKKEKISAWESDSLKVNIGEVEMLLCRFPEVVERSGNEYDPHYIATYLFELAQSFNSYYGNNKIIEKGNKESSYRVALTEAVSVVIKNGLFLLGIKSPERL